VKNLQKLQHFNFIVSGDVLMTKCAQLNGNYEN